MSDIFYDYSKKVLIVGIITLFLACGSDGGDSGNGSTTKETVGQPTTEDNDNWLTGTIVFELTEQGLEFEHLGIYEYFIENDRLLNYAAGVRPRRHPAGEKTVLLQSCSGVGVYRLAIGDTRGLLTPITNCSDTFTIQNHTLRGDIEIQTAAISPDQNLVMTILHDSFYDGDDYKFYYYSFAVIFNPNSDFEQTWSDVRDAAWFPDGSMIMSTMDNRLLLIDSDLKNENYIDQNQFSAPIQDLAVHPDGEFLIFVYDGQIWKVNKDGSDAGLIFKTQWPLRSPAWSPNGDAFVTIAFKNIAGGMYEPFLLFFNVETNESIQIDLRDKIELMHHPWPPLSWNS